MRYIYALALVAQLAGCRDEPPPPPPAPAPVLTDSSGGGVPGPTADEIDAGANILKDAIEGASGGQ
jgi:hypothetical protein